MKGFPKITNQKFHFIGILGRGMSPLAIISKYLGAEVSGCDRAGFQENRELLVNAGVSFYDFHNFSHIDPDSIVITNGAVSNELGELSSAKENLTVWDRNHLLAAVFNEKTGIGITGSHGKGIVTAMVGAALQEANFDPLVLVGAFVPYFKNTTRLGDGIFVSEVDDSDLTLKQISPHISVITNLDEDHPHLNNSMGEVIEAVGKFIANTENLTILGPTAYQNDLIKFSKNKIWTYGKDFGGKIINQNQSSSIIELWAPGVDSIEVELNFILAKPEINAALAFATAFSTGADPTNIVKGMGKVTGLLRRLEKIDSNSKLNIFDDFGGKHPVNVREGLLSLKKHFPNSRISAIFEPYGPYLNMWGSDYLDALELANLLIVLPARISADYGNFDQGNANWHAVRKSAKYIAVDYADAIDTAVSHSGEQDVIVVFGQLREARQISQALAERRINFSENESD